MALDRPYLLPCMAIACISFSAALTSLFLLRETLPKLAHKRYARIAAEDVEVIAESSPGVSSLPPAKTNVWACLVFVSEARNGAEILLAFAPVLHLRSPMYIQMTCIAWHDMSLIWWAERWAGACTLPNKTSSQCPVALQFVNWQEQHVPAGPARSGSPCSRPYNPYWPRDRTGGYCLVG